MPKKARRPERPAEAGAPFGPPSTLPAMRTARGVEPKAGAPSGGIHQTAGDIDRGVEPKAGAPSGNRSARKNRAKRESAATRVPTVYQYSSIALSGLAWRVLGTPKNSGNGPCWRGACDYETGKNRAGGG